MSIRKKEGRMDVAEAARLRIRNVFSNGVPVYMSFSAGKDSLCMSHLVYDQIMQGRIDASLLTVVFIDEEALYPSMEAMTLRWRKRFLSVGAQFRWYCLPLKQISVLRQLQNSESWITWEPGKEDCWVRTPPPWAIRSCPYLEYVGQMTYQDFLTKITRDGIQMTGVRASESVQRLQYIARMETKEHGLSKRNIIAPIYDWKDNDIWLYIKEHDLDFPEDYMDLYRVGTPKPRLRLSNYFASESIAGLRQVAEVDPTLWERIERREPNAYLTLLYWDSEMFHRSTRKRRQMEGEVQKDYKAILTEMLLKHPEKYFTNPGTYRVAMQYRRFFIKSANMMTPKSMRTMHDALVAGDPKLRSLRALFTTVYTDYANYNRADIARRKEADEA